MASSPTVRPVATAVSRQDSSPPRPCRRCAVASVKENSYGPVSTRVPGGCVVSRSVRCSNPPSRQTAVTRSATTRSPTATIALAGIVRVGVGGVRAATGGGGTLSGADTRVSLGRNGAQREGRVLSCRRASGSSAAIDLRASPTVQSPRVRIGSPAPPSSDPQGGLQPAPRPSLHPQTPLSGPDFPSWTGRLDAPVQNSSNHSVWLARDRRAVHRPGSGQGWAAHP